MSEVAGVLVLHEPGPEGDEAVRRAAGLVRSLFVVDNSAPPARLEDLPAQVSLIRNGANLGVARALNQGMLAARAAGFRYALLLDQDSRMSGSCLGRLGAAHGRLGDAVIVGPRVLYGPEAPPPPRAGRAVRRVTVAISSGSLVDLARLEAVGLHDEGLFVDYVDFDLCLRAAARGLAVYRVDEARLYHRLGNQRLARLLGLRFTPTHHSSERRYYKTRNMLLVWARHGRAHPRFMLASARKFVAEFLQIWLFEDSKLAKTLACLEGAADALRGRTGPRPGPLARPPASGAR